MPKLKSTFVLGNGATLEVSMNLNPYHYRQVGCTCDEYEYDTSKCTCHVSSDPTSDVKEFFDMISREVFKVLIEKALPKSQELGVMIEDGDDPYPSKKDLGIHYCRYCNDAGCGACDCDCD